MLQMPSMFASLPTNQSQNVVEQAKLARQERLDQKRRTEAAVTIQSVFRGYTVRGTLFRNAGDKFDSLFRPFITDQQCSFVNGLERATSDHPPASKNIALHNPLLDYFIAIQWYHYVAERERRCSVRANGHPKKTQRAWNACEAPATNGRRIVKNNKCFSDKECVCAVSKFLTTSIQKTAANDNFIPLLVSKTRGPQLKTLINAFNRQACCVLQTFHHVTEEADAKLVLPILQYFIVLSNHSFWGVVIKLGDVDSQQRNLLEKPFQNLSMQWMRDVWPQFVPAMYMLLLNEAKTTGGWSDSGTAVHIITSFMAVMLRCCTLLTFERVMLEQEALLALIKIPNFLTTLAGGLVAANKPLTADNSASFTSLAESLRTNGTFAKWCQHIENDLVPKSLVFSFSTRTKSSSSAAATNGKLPTLTNVDANTLLVVLGNYAQLIQLISYDSVAKAPATLLSYLSTALRILDELQSSAQAAKNLPVWHPALGWTSTVSSGQVEVLDLSTAVVSRVLSQIEVLWSSSALSALFNTPVATAGETPSKASPAAKAVDAEKQKKSSSFIAAVKKRIHSNNLLKSYDKAELTLGDAETTVLALECHFYQLLVNTLSPLRLQILTGLCSREYVVQYLWRKVKAIGMQQFLSLLQTSKCTACPEFRILSLFCNCASHLIIVMDDVELYEEQHYFTLTELETIARVLNQCVFEIVWNELLPLDGLADDSLFVALHSLLTLLYNRNSRRKFVADDSVWLMKRLRGNFFEQELTSSQHCKHRALMVLRTAPQCVRFHDRAKLLRKWIMADKVEHHDPTVPTVLIKIRRNSVVEDGYAQLSRLRGDDLKRTIRVRFINEQGLDEAGIDQDGVFKEFLELTIKNIFNPALNLFRTTAEHRLYPSSLSYMMQEANHLSLFEFVGRVLGKTVYEGIVVDCPFAMFFLSEILGRTKSTQAYSYFDELPSLDRNLYKSLTEVKRYNGNVRDLGLNFSYDEDVMGKIVSHDLVPGGSCIEVNNENRISYVHLVAHFRMKTQIKHQTAAFKAGFNSIIQPNWLEMFSAPEVQKLISGDTERIDIQDLKKHVQYFGGFHGTHRVISWLFDVLENDFTEEERQLFLRFVTSCSKPPLLGFANLEPRFSIRCVEVGEDDDAGDTLGSVLRGFLGVGVGRRHRESAQRLPTSSTCFNLLKLPNYPKKSMLRDKLRYAVSSNTGFELS